MADTAISALPEASALDGTELYAVVQDGTTKRTTIGSLGTAAAADVTTSDSDDTSGRVLRIDDYLDRAGESDDAWTEVTSLDNGWTGKVWYIKRAGWVTVALKVDGSSKSGNTLITLPSGYRPGIDLTVPHRSDVNNERLLIRDTGTVDSNSDHNAVQTTVTYPVL